MKNKDKTQSKQETKGERVLVYVRIRPFNEDELNRDKTSPIELIDQKTNSMISKIKKNKKIYKKNYI